MLVVPLSVAHCLSVTIFFALSLQQSRYCCLDPAPISTVQQDNRVQMFWVKYCIHIVEETR